VASILAIRFVRDAPEWLKRQTAARSKNTEEIQHTSFGSTMQAGILLEIRDGNADMVGMGVDRIQGDVLKFGGVAGAGLGNPRRPFC
jgi:hypothetical protein